MADRASPAGAGPPAHPLWDLPTRLFHWSLVPAVFLSWLSQEREWAAVHLWSGYAVLVLVSFRFFWGFFGSRHSRFSDFVRGPAAVLSYWRGTGGSAPGHNPAGGWSVLALLLLLSVQALTGLFNSDGLLFDGPLHHALDSSWTDKLGEVHDSVFWVLLAFVALHILAVAYYEVLRGDKLIGPMVTGGAGGAEPAVPPWRALVVLLLCIGALSLAVLLAPEPEVYW